MKGFANIILLLGAFVAAENSGVRNTEEISVLQNTLKEKISSDVEQATADLKEDKDLYDTLADPDVHTNKVKLEIIEELIVAEETLKGVYES